MSGIQPQPDIPNSYAPAFITAVNSASPDARELANNLIKNSGVGVHLRETRPLHSVWEGG